MKRQILMKSVVIVLLAGLMTACSSATSLSPEDRAFLVENRRATEQAKNDAVRAAEEAKDANKAAATAAAAASSVSEKTSRIYERSQNK